MSAKRPSRSQSKNQFVPLRKLISFDWAMKTVLKQKSFFDILEGLISTIIKEDIKIDAILETESNKDIKDGKVVRTDIQARNTSGDIYIIEVQYAYEVHYFHRILYSTATATKEYLKEGDQVDKIKRVISITVAYSSLGIGNDYVYQGNNQFYGIHDSSLLELEEIQKKKYKIKHLKQIFPEYWIIRLKQYQNQLNDELDQWIYFLKNELVENDFSAKGLKAAAEKLLELKIYENRLHEFHEYEKFKVERNTLIAKAEEDKEFKKTYLKTIQEKNKTIQKNKKTIEQNKKTIEQNKKTIEQSILSLYKYIKNPQTLAKELKLDIKIIKSVLTKKSKN